MSDGGKPLPIFSLADVEAHGPDADRVWMAISGRVYDVTDYVDEHPGGDVLMVGVAGHLLWGPGKWCLSLLDCFFFFFFFFFFWFVLCAILPTQPIDLGLSLPPGRSRHGRHGHV